MTTLGCPSRPLTIEDLEAAKAAILEELKLLGKLVAARLQSHLLQAAKLQSGNHADKVADPQSGTVAPSNECCVPSDPGKMAVRAGDAQFDSRVSSKVVSMDRVALEALFHQRTAHDVQLPSLWERELELRLQAHTPTPSATPFHSTGVFGTPESSCPASPFVCNFPIRTSRTAHSTGGASAVLPPGSRLPPFVTPTRLSRSAHPSCGGACGASDGPIPTPSSFPAACPPLRCGTVVPPCSAPTSVAKVRPGAPWAGLPQDLSDVVAAAGDADADCGEARSADPAELSFVREEGSLVKSLGASTWSALWTVSDRRGASAALRSRLTSEGGEAAGAATVAQPLSAVSAVRTGMAARSSVSSSSRRSSSSSSSGGGLEFVQRRELPGDIVQEIVRQLVQFGGGAGLSHRSSSRGSGGSEGAAAGRLYDNRPPYYAPVGPTLPAATVPAAAATCTTAAPAPAAHPDQGVLDTVRSPAWQPMCRDGSSNRALEKPYVQLEEPLWGGDTPTAPGRWSTVRGLQTGLRAAPPPASGGAAAAAATAAAAVAVDTRAGARAPAAATAGVFLASTGPSSCALSLGGASTFGGTSETVSSQLALSYSSTPASCRTASSGAGTSSPASSPLPLSVGRGADCSYVNSPLPAAGADSRMLYVWNGAAD